jgi:Protein of unknown function (DUF4232)
MRRVFLLMALGTAALLSACGGSSGGGSSSSPSSAANSTSSQTTTTASTSTTAPATQTASVRTLSSSRCVAADLRLRFLGQQGATGHGLLGFALRNRSTHTCHTFGFPGILFLDQAGGALPTNSTRTTHDYFGTAPRVSLVLAPGQRASFRIGVTHGMTSTNGCTTAYGLQVIPPDDTATLRTRIPGGAYECGTATLSPLRPGYSAYR